MCLSLTPMSGSLSQRQLRRLQYRVRAHGTKGRRPKTPLERSNAVTLLQAYAAPHQATLAGSLLVPCLTADHHMAHARQEALSFSRQGAGPLATARSGQDTIPTAPPERAHGTGSLG
ncbi:hypothetical protein BDZ91DRAFT_550139 [Kalaharituber pfeilii]|nr:hypothetical protein BDZ91DRAFT_550139 [Kalaharituber pfeilii]